MALQANRVIQASTRSSFAVHPVDFCQFTFSAFEQLPVESRGYYQSSRSHDKITDNDLNQEKDKDNKKPNLNSLKPSFTASNHSEPGNMNATEMLLFHQQATETQQLLFNSDEK